MNTKITVTFKVSGPADHNYTKSTDPFGEQEPLVPVDLRKAECPYCGGALKKIPVAKSKCPHCKQSMCVRTRPTDNARVVVSKEEAERIDAYWRIARSGPEPDFRHLVNKQQVDEERKRLQQKFRDEEPSDDDVKWALLNKISFQHAERGEWGLYRNIRLTMADFLTRRMKLREALRHYLEVCTLDLNGATNRPQIPELQKEFPPFDIRHTFTAPVVLRQVTLIAKKLELKSDMLKDFYLVNNLAAEMKLPLSPQSSWTKLESALNQRGKDD